MSEINNQKPDFQSKPNNKQPFVIVGSLVLALTAGVGGYILAGRPGSTTILNTVNPQSSSASSEGSVSRGNIDLEDSSSSSVENTADPVVNLPEEDADKVLAERQTLNQYLSAQLQFNPEAIVESPEAFSLQQVQAAKEELTAETSPIDAPVVRIEPGKKVNVTLEYSSVGDQGFVDASLFIKLSDGLKVVPGTMVETVGGQQFKMADSVYNTETNLIKYGPKSTDKASAGVDVGQRGTVTFSAEIANPELKSYAISSYLKDIDGKVGQPGIVFIDQ